MTMRKRMKVKPYLLRDYSIAALKVIEERVLDLKIGDHQEVSLAKIMVQREATGKTPFIDPEYGAKWSVLSRKRKSGLLLTWIYYIAEKEKLDMTAVFAQRLLQGLVGSSISNRVLIEAFGKSERTAANKSIDWDRIDGIIDKYRGPVTASLLRDKEKIALIKNKVWSEQKSN